jgi:hypothetical protein
LAFLQTSGVILRGTNVGKIIASGGHIQIFVNNQLVLDFTDPHPIPFGGIGLGAIWEVNAWFDNVIVTPTHCPAGFVGKYGFDARLTNTSNSLLSGLSVKVTTLTGDNLLQNADGGPGGVGAILTVPETLGYADGLLSKGEYVDVPFVICLKKRTKFSFFVDVWGIAQ